MPSTAKNAQFDDVVVEDTPETVNMAMELAYFLPGTFRTTNMAENRQGGGTSM